MKITAIIVSLAALQFMSVNPAEAQDTQPTMIEADWYNVIFLKFKPGARARAEEIQETYYAPAGRAAGLPKSMMLHMNTGDWDMIRIGPMTYGPASIGVADSEFGRRWWAELVKIAGGEDQAMAIDKEFDSLLENRRRDIAHVDKD